MSNLGECYFCTKPAINEVALKFEVGVSPLLVALTGSVVLQVRACRGRDLDGNSTEPGTRCCQDHIVDMMGAFVEPAPRSDRYRQKLFDDLKAKGKQARENWNRRN